MIEFFEKNIAFLIIVSIVGLYVVYDVIKERKAGEKKEREKKIMQKNAEEIQDKTEESQKKEEK